MKRLLFISTIILVIMNTVSSCGLFTGVTRGQQFPNMYEEEPIALLVMPPINETTNVEAKELLYTSISLPLCEAGYYVFSPHMMMTFLKEESAYDAEMFIDKDLNIFNRILGADAVIFSTIHKWQKEGFGIRTEIEYKIVSAHTNEVLFERNCDLFLDMDSSTEASLTSMLVAAIGTALTDHIVAARKCNAYVFQDLPHGKYSDKHLKDTDEYALPKEVRTTVK